MIMQHEVNMTLGYFASSAMRDFYMTSSYVYYTSNLIWMIPPGRTISSLEKLARPFQATVWIYFLLVLGIAFVVVMILNFQSKKAQEFLFGANVSAADACLNVSNVVLGGSVHKLPTRNFARIILLMFMFYGLIMQNSYKGGLFKFMQMTIREPEMTSTDEMVKSNFKFYMLAASRAYLTELPRIMELAVFTSVTEFVKKTDQVLDPEFKGAVLTSNDHLAYRNIKAFPNKFFRHAPETIFTNNIVIYMNKQSCLVNQVNQIIINSANGGLIEKWASHYIDKKFLNHKSSRKAVGLTMTQLSGAFQLLLLGLCISFLFFMAEQFFNLNQFK